MTTEHPQKFMMDFCPLEKRMTKWVTNARDNTIIVCTNCPYTKSISKDTKPMEEEPKKENWDEYKLRLLSSNNKGGLN